MRRNIVFAMIFSLILAGCLTGCKETSENRSRNTRSDAATDYNENNLNSDRTSASNREHAGMLGMQNNANENDSNDNQNWRNRTDSRQNDSESSQNSNSNWDSRKGRVQPSRGINEIKAPAIFKPDRIDGNDVYYTLTAQSGTVNFESNTSSATAGYNGQFMGPTLKLSNGQRVHVRIRNQLNEVTTVHWHGLDVPADADGGPHQRIAPKGQRDISFMVNQGPATLWYHPHPHHKTGSQVYQGLAGLLIVEDKVNKNGLPSKYGIDDIPLILQDKTFQSGKMVDYSRVVQLPGTYGNTVLINGVKDPRLTVPRALVRLRILNGSTARDYQLSFDKALPVQQIASDGGYLNQGIPLSDIDMSPAERMEMLVDFRKVSGNEINLIDANGSIILPIKIADSQIQSASENIPLDTSRLNNITISETERKIPVTQRFVMQGMYKDVAINNMQFDHDRVDFKTKVGQMQVWEIENLAENDPRRTREGAMLHPFHVHGAQFRVVSLNDKAPPPQLQGLKDTIGLRPGDKVKILLEFKHSGLYMLHCHIIEHEDNGMMLQFMVEP